jgi:DNA-binding response OmpR family regulator
MTAAKDLLEGKRILLVDDEPDVLASLADLLPMCETVKASNFKAAKAYLENEYFDLTVLDIMGVEGYQLLEIANQKRVMAVMLTAHAVSPENIVKSFKEGAASYRCRLLSAQRRNGQHRLFFKRCSRGSGTG